MKKVKIFTAMKAAALFGTIVFCCLAAHPADAQLIPQLPKPSSPMPGGPTQPAPGKPPAIKPAPTNPLATPANPTQVIPAAKDIDADKPVGFAERQLLAAREFLKAAWIWLISTWALLSTFIQVAFLALFVILRITYYVHRQRRTREEDELERLEAASEPEFGPLDEGSPFHGKEIVS